MNLFQHCKWLRVFGSLMVAIVLSIVGISAYSVYLVCMSRIKHGPPAMLPIGVRAPRPTRRFGPGGLVGETTGHACES
jgi:hypothetical protein